MAEAEQLQSPAAVGKGPDSQVRRWLLELNLASKSEKDWRESGQKIVSRYRGEGAATTDGQDKRKADAYNVLYANVQTLGPILYNSTPEPDIKRRFDDPDVTAKAAGEVLRRALKYTLSCQDFDEIATLAVQDYLLPGRAVVSVKYVPTTSEVADAAETDPDDEKQAPVAVPNGATAAPAPPVDGQAAPDAAAAPAGGESGVDGGAKTEEVVYEEIRFDLTPWRSFRRGPGRTWQDVPWIGYELELTREACIELFGEEIGRVVPLQSAMPDDKAGDRDDISKETAFQRARVWQIWDKAARQVIYICPDYEFKPLKVSADEYNLSSFYNTPRPLYAVETSDSLVPVSEFTLYESLANEAEVLTNRMSKLARAIRVRGAYAANLPEIEKILEASETKLIPVLNADEWAERGGLANAVWMWPVEKMIEAYQAIGVQREMIKQSIYEILGVADIMRGSTDPNETATSQTIKVKWGSLRTRRRQAEVQRYCRDLMRIAAEMIAEKFSAQTLAMMTGLWFPTAQEKALVQMKMQPQQPMPGQPPAQPIPPEVQEQAKQMLALPTWDEIVAFLRNDALRHFRVDIQTDSTIAMQDAEDQGDYAKMMAAVVGLFTALAPAVQSGALPFEAAKSIIMGLARKFRLGPEVEAQLEQMKQPPAPDPSKNPKVLEAQAKAQASAASDQARVQADIAIQQHRTDTEAKLSAQKNQMEAIGKAIESLPAIIIQHLKNVGAIEVARIKVGADLGDTLLAHELQASEQQPQMPSTPTQ